MRTPQTPGDLRARVAALTSARQVYAFRSVLAELEPWQDFCNTLVDQIMRIERELLLPSRTGECINEYTMGLLQGKLEALRMLTETGEEAQESIRQLDEEIMGLQKTLKQMHDRARREAPDRRPFEPPTEEEL